MTATETGRPALADQPPDAATSTTACPPGSDLVRLSARFGLAFTIAQLTVMVAMVTIVLPHGGSPGSGALDRGRSVLEVQELYRVGNYAFMLAGTLLLGFLGAVAVHLRRVDASGVLAVVAVSSGALLALVWPLGGLLHDVALEAASAGSDLRLLGGWDSVAPYTLALSVLPRTFFVGAIVLGLRRAGTAPWLQRTGWVLLPIGLVGSAVTITAAVFPLLALSTLGYELWVGFLAWHWLRGQR
ncbi:hypothetical protein E8D34_08495 [Nocardioides sp. GY 10113]|uniref:hypothetical protein n=1 Tax=Nocardioides sp. GY 10113 TaxID=2569761 RepID=UPI0010A8AA01|nr:hypothetical protein [Nocardioides sp. GY 10113]TIC87705.1 hypothetical protein E8D34_08495 [Nocardioides sp. GY 10113]